MSATAPNGPMNGHRLKPDGGYIHVSTFRFGVAWWCYLEGKLSLRAVRVLLALHELGIERSAYVWTERKQGRGVPEFTPRFSVGELATVCGLPLKRARAALKELLALGLLADFAPERITFARTIDELALPEDDRSAFFAWLDALTKRKRIPVPRRILSLACESSSPAQIAFIWGAVLRCVYLKPAEGFTYSGWLSLSWLSSRMGLSLSALKAAKSHLVKLGWVGTGRVSRHGEKLSINPAWKRIQETVEGTAAGTKSGPHPADSGTKSGPPKTRESSFGTEIQKPRESPQGEEPGPGIFKTHEGKTLENPRLSSIKPEDFQDVGRALELYRQAVKCKLVEDSDHARLRWLAAIERARTVPAKNPAGVFLHLVKNRLWGYLSDGHWFAAHERLHVHLYGPLRSTQSSPFAASIGRQPEPQRPPKRVLSEDAKFVHAVRVVLRQRGVRDGDPLPYLRRHDASWNRERLLAAEVELSRPNYLEHAH